MSESQVKAVSYSRVSSERQDLELSVSGQQRAIREWSEKNGYVLVREYIDEAESGRFDTRDGFLRMIEHACEPNPRFRAILVWKHDRFSRRREHAVIYKARLRDRGIRLVSVTEPSDDTPSGRLLEAMIEGLAEYYSENLAEDTWRGMRESALRGNFLGPKPPFGYRKVRELHDKGQIRIALETVPEEAETLRYVFELALEGKGLKEIAKDLNSRGITNRGTPWYRNSLHWVLTNEASAGTLVWGRRRNRGKAHQGAPPTPVRIEDAWPAIVTRELFAQVQATLAERSPKKVMSHEKPLFLLTGLLICGSCGNHYGTQAAKGNRYHYYVCRTLLQRGAGTCQARYFNAEVLDEKCNEQLAGRLTSPPSMPLLADVPTPEASDAAEELTEVVAHINTTLERLEERLEGGGDPARHQSVQPVSTLPRLAFLESRKQHLLLLRDEVARSKARINQMAAYDGSDAGTYSLTAMVEECRQSLVNGPATERKEIIDLLVERVVADSKGQVHIQLKHPFIWLPETSSV